jgi:cyclase
MSSGSEANARLPLSRERITAAAIELADDKGVEQLSMRNLAARLGVEAMSLYNHVKNKDDLLDAMLDAVVGEISLPVVGGDWRAEMRRRSHGMHDVFVAHPWVVPLFASRISIGSNMITLIDRTVGCLFEAGFSYPAADQVWHTIECHTFGFLIKDQNFPIAPGDYASAAQSFLPMLPEELYPYMNRSAKLIADGTYDGRNLFSFGLDLLLDTLERWRRDGSDFPGKPASITLAERTRSFVYPSGATMRIFRPYPEVFAFYDGRVVAPRMVPDRLNWFDDGAFSLGTASYAIVDGDEALVYDANMSVNHAALIRRTLEEAGCTKFRLVLSHWHTDHVIGNPVFADCEIIANRFTVKAMFDNETALALETPPIAPLVFPTRMFETSLALKVGSLDVELRHFNIHSHDGTAMLLPNRGLLFAGDGLEDSVTYVAEPEQLATHLKELERLRGWRFERILPNHGDPDIIARGGYGRALIDATRLYVEKLLTLKNQPDLARLSLADFAKDAFATGGASWFEPYEEVHRNNVKLVLALS